MERAKHSVSARTARILGCAIVACSGLVAWLLFGSETANTSSATSPTVEPASLPAPSTPAHEHPEAGTPDAPAVIPEPGERVARTAASPALTLTAHLIERGKQLPWGEPGKVSRQPNIQLDRAIADRQMNPEGKQLDRAQQIELAKMLGELDAEYESLWLQMCAERKAVLLRSVEAGRVRSVSQSSLGVPDDIFSSRNRAKAGIDQQRQFVAELTQRFGAPMKDWGYADMSSNEPDGIARQNLVYWTRVEEPEFFRLQAACSALQVEHMSRVRSFFERH